MDPAEGSPDGGWQRLFLVGQHFHAAVRLDDEKDKLEYPSGTSFGAGVPAVHLEGFGHRRGAMAIWY